MLPAPWSLPCSLAGVPTEPVSDSAGGSSEPWSLVALEPPTFSARFLRAHRRFESSVRARFSSSDLGRLASACRAQQDVSD